MDTLQKAFDPAEFRKLGHWLVDRLGEHLESSFKAEVPVVAYRSPEEEWCAWHPAEASFESLVNRLLTQSMHLHHPHYVGHQTGVVSPVSALTELVTALMNNSGAIFEMGPGSGMVERHTLQWMASKLGFGPEADGTFTSGGTLGNLTALLAARRRILGPESWIDGTTAHPPACFLASTQIHYSITRAVQIMGWGEQIVEVPMDSGFRLDASRLEAAFTEATRRGRRVIGVIGNAGSTATGSYDDLEAISRFCRPKQIWLHVDGAHGATAVLSPKYASLAKGIAEADSVVWDAHKLMMAPGLSTAVLFKRGGDSYEIFRQEASYLFSRDAKSEWYNPSHRTIECTKRDLAFRVYVSLCLYGESFFADYLERVYDQARTFADKIEATSDFALAVRPESNILCFRRRDWTGPEGDLKHRALRQRIIERGRFYLVQTKLSDGIYLRATLMNPFTTARDLDELLDEIRLVAAQVDAVGEHGHVNLSDGRPTDSECRE